MLGAEEPHRKHAAMTANPRAAFQALLAGPGCVHPASVYDAATARIAADLGYECAILGGSVASAAVLAAPDLMVMTLSELAGLVRRITRAAPLPLLVDADHGFGNALSAARTVEELEAAGAAALTLEDTLLPQPFGESATRLVSLEEGLGKIRAGLAVRRDPMLSVIARTGALSVTGLEDALARARAYAAAGADGLFLTGVQSLEQLAALRAAVDLPLLVGGSREGLGDAAALAGLGVRVMLQGHHSFPAALRAVEETLRALRQGGAPPASDPALLRRALRTEDYEAAGRAFLQPPRPA